MCRRVQLFIDTQLFSRIFLPEYIKILLSIRKNAMFQSPCLQTWPDRYHALGGKSRKTAHEADFSSKQRETGLLK